MICECCAQSSDPLDRESDWTPLDERAVHTLYECDDCGFRQRAR